MSATRASTSKGSQKTKRPSPAAEKPVGRASESSPSGPAEAAKPKSNKRANKKRTALDAAAKVLGAATEALTTRQMVEVMEAKSYWTSPGGATPWSTLYSAILREIAAKGKDARFTKTGRGTFALKG